MTNKQDKTEKLGINTRLTHDGYEPRDYHGFVVNPLVVRGLPRVLFPDAQTMATGNQNTLTARAEHQQRSIMQGNRCP